MLSGIVTGRSASELAPTSLITRAEVTEPLSLKEMAKHFHFNASYLSSYFTTHNKEGFIEYLNRIRIDKASQLLRSDSAVISEIGNRVGYSDHSYFCKVFKKITGLSPSQYRRQYQR